MIYNFCINILYKMEDIDWKWIKISVNGIEYDYTNMYRIYRDGKVESVKRKGVLQSRFLKEATNYPGYKYVHLSKDNKSKNHSIHRLVACHFIPNPHDFSEVDHINRERGDNSIENLRWCSSSTNNRNLTKKRKCDLPRGVYITSSGKYRVRIKINGKNKWLGTYDTIEEASNIYEEATLEQITNELNNISI